MNKKIINEYKKLQMELYKFLTKKPKVVSKKKKIIP